MPPSCVRGTNGNLIQDMDSTNTKLEIVRHYMASRLIVVRRFSQLFSRRVWQGRNLGAENFLGDYVKKTKKTDGRTREARKFNAIVAEIIGLVGKSLPFPVLERLARQFAALSVRQEKIISRMLDGHVTSAGDLVRLCNASNRTMRNLGLTPTDNGDDDAETGSLEKYIQSKRKTDRRRFRLVDK